MADTFDQRFAAMYHGAPGYEPAENMPGFNEDYGRSVGMSDEEIRRRKMQAAMSETFAPDRYNPVSDVLLRRRYNLLPGGM